MRCTSCGSCEVTQIGFTSGNGTTYRYCRVCETGHWESDGQQMGTKQALSVASAIPPMRPRHAAA